MSTPAARLTRPADRSVASPALGRTGPSKTGGGRAKPHGTSPSSGDAPDRARRWAFRLVGPVVLVGLLVAAGLRFFGEQSDSVPRGPAPGQQRFEDLLSGLRARADANPADLSAWQQLGATHVSAAARNGDPTHYQQADVAFERADALVLNHPDTLWGRATVALGRHHFALALELGEQAASLRPAHAPTLAVLVDAAVELGRYDEAAARSQELLNTRPGVTAWTRAAYQRELHGDPNGAMAALVAAEAATGGLNEVRQQGPASRLALATVLSLQGEVLTSSGAHQAATARYQLAAELSPGLTLTELGLARSEASAGRYQASMERLTRLTETTPTLGAATLLADVQLLAGVTPTGEELVDAIVALQRAGGASIDLELAVHLADRGRPDVALATAAYEAQPSIYGADSLAWTLTRAGRASEALPHVTRALSLGTRDAALLARAALTYEALGDANRARQLLQQAFEINPSFTFSLRETFTATAQRLGVTVPAAWSR